MGRNGDFTVQFARQRPVGPRNDLGLSQGRVLFVPATGPMCPDTVPPKMFMFVGSDLDQAMGPLWCSPIPRTVTLLVLE